MSILSALYHGEIHDCPNATHDLAPGQKQDTERMDAESAAMCPPVTQPDDAGQQEQTADGRERWAKQLEREGAGGPSMPAQQAAKQAQSLNCVGRSRDAWQAKLEGGLRPDLYYTGQEAVPSEEGWEESPHTVASKLESKEEFPQG